MGAQSRLDDIKSPKMESVFTATAGATYPLSLHIPEPILESCVRTFEQTRSC